MIIQMQNRKMSWPLNLRWKFSKLRNNLTGYYDWLGERGIDVSVQKKIQLFGGQFF